MRIDSHWSEKKREDMTERDWRIFRWAVGLILSCVPQCLAGPRVKAGGCDGARLAHPQPGLPRPCLCSWQYAVVQAEPRHGRQALQRKWNDFGGLGTACLVL